MTQAAHERFQQAVALFMQGRHADTVPLLTDAAQAGDAEAQNLLGVMNLNALGVPQDTRRAEELFASAADAGLKEGHYNLSNLLFNSLGTKRDEPAAKRHLISAAKSGHKPALRSLGYMYHLMGDKGHWPALATSCFETAARLGDPLSKYNAGLRAWRGLGAPVDAARAAYWLEAASRDGLLLAPTRLQALQQSSPQAAPRAEPHPMTNDIPDLPEWEFPPQEMPPLLNSLSFVSEYGSVLDETLCDHLINIGSPQLMPAGVVDPVTGTPFLSEMRTSHSMYFKPAMYDALTGWIWARLSKLAGMPAEHAEPLVVMRYAPGQEYKQHRDYFTDGKKKAQRLVTVFVYLNDVEAGGDTAFPALGISVQPERGKAVKFLNCHPDGSPNPDTLHAGLPVIRGEKWLATIWFWDRPYRWFG